MKTPVRGLTFEFVMIQQTRPSLLAVLCLWTLFVAGCHSSGGGAGSMAPAAAPSLSLQHATLINPGSTALPDASVSISNGRITCAGTSTACPRPTGAKVIDLGGMYLGPGLIDAHVHYSQTGWVDGRPDAIDLRSQYPYDSVVRSLEAHPERFQRADLCSGVTSVFDVGGFPWTYQLAHTTRDATDAPRVVVTGPLLATIKIDPEMMGAFDFMANDSVVRASVRAHRNAGAEAIKVWYINVPDSLHPWAKAMLLAAGDEARKAGLRLVVHATELPNARDALEAGTSVLVHNVDEGTVDEAFIQEVKRNGTIVIPTLTVFELPGLCRRQPGAISRPALPARLRGPDHPEETGDGASRQSPRAREGLLGTAPRPKAISFSPRPSTIFAGCTGQGSRLPWEPTREIRGLHMAPASTGKWS